MSILVVRVVPQGLVFGADRNITEIETRLGSGQTVTIIHGQSQRPKVLRWPNRRAIIGYVGVATVGGMPTDEWIYDFIGENLNFTSFEVLAKKLKQEVEKQRRADEGTGEPEVLIIHLGGFEERSSHMVPVVWYIRNSHKLVNDFYTDVRKDFLVSEEFWGNYKDISPSQIKSHLEQKLNSTNFPTGFQQGYNLGTFNTFDMFLKGAFLLLYQTFPDITFPDSLREWEQQVKMSILTYGAYFETYKGAGEKYVGGGADVVSLAWPEMTSKI